MGYCEKSEQDVPFTSNSNDGNLRRNPLKILLACLESNLRTLGLEDGDDSMSDGGSRGSRKLTSDSTKSLSNT